MQDDVATMISDLEHQIEALWDQHKGALKSILLARCAFWLGLALMGLVVIGWIRNNAVETGILGLSLFLGGIIFNGSSQASADQIQQHITELEARRDALIDQLPFRAKDTNVIPFPIGQGHSLH
ncbi:MAG: hypothetical protein EBY21_01995 [Alphaproteobacteria bacterium]|nr:hypothetical protein [Alphaproteobacteria bacterium]